MLVKIKVARFLFEISSFYKTVGSGSRYDSSRTDKPTGGDSREVENATLGVLVRCGTVLKVDWICDLRSECAERRVFPPFP